MLAGIVVFHLHPLQQDQSSKRVAKDQGALNQLQDCKPILHLLCVLLLFQQLPLLLASPLQAYYGLRTKYHQL